VIFAARTYNLPDGQITSTFPLASPSTPSRKNIPLRDYPKSPVQIARSIPPEGRIAIVTDLGVECGGRGSVARANVSQGGPFDRLRERDQRAGRATLQLSSPRASRKRAVPGEAAWRRRVRGRRSRVVLTPVAGAKPAGGSCQRPTGRDKPSIHGRR
jgi:hypothetical protein